MCSQPILAIFFLECYQRHSVAGGEVVERNHMVSFFKEEISGDRADVAASTGDEYVHRWPKKLCTADGPRYQLGRVSTKEGSGWERLKYMTARTIGKFRNSCRAPARYAVSASVESR